ncbi:28S ribosomal protein S35, mitochondrial [Monodelphis domestica]|uniref:Mitochondrial ribosomal protein S35 n=1 Tax=Monodelphis domestica TaxID=13616 RepID=F7BGK1_MONDO|nr:28S ribosomal protein S35, mitochondrial [Monodelphis domestica]
MFNLAIFSQLHILLTPRFPSGSRIPQQETRPVAIPAPFALPLRISFSTHRPCLWRRAMAAPLFPLRQTVRPRLWTLRTLATVLSPTSDPQVPNTFTAESNKTLKSGKNRKQIPNPRTTKMTVDQDWMSVYPAAAPFKPSAVPLPVRMGYPVEKGVPPAKEGNLELLKIPNFLHLTPVAIKKHCAVLKDFCTDWPSALDSDEKCEKHFPIEIETADYVSAGPSIYNPKARIVTLKVRLSSLNLDDHAKKKFIKLVGERYCKNTDLLTITTDRCPLRRQNYDYAMYLLTVLYHESWKTEDWEKKKTEADMEEYIWEKSRSEENILNTLLQIKASEKTSGVTEEELLGSEEIKNYKKSVVALKNEGDTENNLFQYKEAVKKLLNLT